MSFRIRADYPVKQQLSWNLPVARLADVHSRVPDGLWRFNACVPSIQPVDELGKRTFAGSGAVNRPPDYPGRPMPPGAASAMTRSWRAGLPRELYVN
jgi:hypothetical protein